MYNFGHSSFSKYNQHFPKCKVPYLLWAQETEKYVTD